MALTEAQKRYQTSTKGREARARYMAKKQAQKIGKAETEVKANVVDTTSKEQEIA